MIVIFKALIANGLRKELQILFSNSRSATISWAYTEFVSFRVFLAGCKYLRSVYKSMLEVLLFLAMCFVEPRFRALWLPGFYNMGIACKAVTFAQNIHHPRTSTWVYALLIVAVGPSIPSRKNTVEPLISDSLMWLGLKGSSTL